MNKSTSTGGNKMKTTLVDPKEKLSHAEMNELRKWDLERKKAIRIESPKKAKAARIKMRRISENWRKVLGNVEFTRAYDQKLLARKTKVLHNKVRTHEGHKKPRGSKVKHSATKITNLKTGKSKIKGKGNLEQ